MEGDSTAETKQPELEASRVNQRRVGLVNDSQVVNLVLASTELLHNANILDQAPDGEHWDGEGDGSGKEEGELGEGEVDRRAVQLVQEGRAPGLRWDREQLVTGALGDERRVLEKVAENPDASAGAKTIDTTGPVKHVRYSLVTHTLQRVGVQKAKVAGVNDGRRLVETNKTIELVVCAHAGQSSVKVVFYRLPE